ncbi:MAG: EamA family transporter [Bacillota bacterium]|nr:EamA family transporter [Bacillota bacterium]
MPQYFWPLSLVVFSNAAYHVASKSTPQNANPFISLIVTYLIAASACLALFFMSPHQKGFIESFSGLSWVSVALGVTIVGLEYGYLMAYRLGADVSTGPLMSYIALSVLLIPIGILFYRENVSLTQVAGVGLCFAGLLLINK